MAPVAHVANYRVIGTSKVDGDSMSMFYRDCRYLSLYPDSDKPVEIEVTAVVPPHKHGLHFVLAARTMGETGVTLSTQMLDYESGRWVEVDRRRLMEHEHTLDINVNTHRMVKGDSGDTSVRLIWTPDDEKLTHVDIDTIAWYARKPIAA